MPNINYIADHIDRIERRHGGNQNLILNSKWRIASNLNLFGDELNPDGTLTPEQVSVVDSSIVNFKLTAEGQQAIASYQRVGAQEASLETLFAIAFKGDA
jgi:hypothetical protein